MPLAAWPEQRSVARAVGSGAHPEAVVVASWCFLVVAWWGVEAHATQPVQQGLALALALARESAQT